MPTTTPRWNSVCDRSLPGRFLGWSTANYLAVAALFWAFANRDFNREAFFG